MSVVIRVLWGDIWKLTSEKRQANAISVNLHPPGRKFEEAYVKRCRKKRTLLHFFVVYNLQGGCFNLFRVEDSKIRTKKWKFQFKHFPVGYLCFPFFGRDFGIFNFFGSSKVSMLNEIFENNIRKKFPANTNTNIIRFEKITRIRIRIIFGLKNYPNTNTNNIRFEKITRIRIRIIFGFKKSPEYEYEY